MAHSKICRVAAAAGFLAALLLARGARADLPETAIPIGAATEFGAQASWSVPSTAETRAAVLNWLDSVSKIDERKPSPEIRQQVEKLWPADEPAGLGADEVLDRVGQTIALVEPGMKEIVEFCSKHRESLVAPDFTVLADEKLDPFVRNNMRLLLGRWLAQERYYDESLAHIGKLEPKDVVDPAALLFYQSVNHHWFLDKQAGMKTIGKLFEQRERLPRRYATVAMLMQADLRALKDESLDHISRRMNDITRRLDFGRAGKKVQGVENGVIASLDKLIEELEKQQQQGAGNGGGGGPGGQNRGPAQGIRSSNPASESTPAQGKGPGNIDKKRIGSSSGWGDLPAKEREEALQQIGKDFPSHYREIVESYFKKIAESE
jgi:hypothetical protein